MRDHRVGGIHARGYIARLLNAASKPRLIELIDFDRPKGGSFVPMVSGLLDEARSRGWRTDAVLVEGARDAEWAPEIGERAEVHIAPAGSDRRLGRFLSSIHDEHPGPTILHSHFHGFDIASVLARYRGSDIAVVWHVHSVFSSRPGKFIPTALKFGTLGRSVDAYFCPAPNIVDEARKRLAPSDRVEFVPSAIALEGFAPADDGFRQDARAKLDIPGDALVLLHFGWHRYLKGGDIFIEALRVLRDRGIEVLALERGGGEEYREDLSRMGLDDGLRFIEPIDDVRALHAAADVLVSPSRNEGMAYALIESLAVGTPVVATDIPGHAFLGENMPACKMTAHDPVDVARGIREILDRPPEVAQAEREQAQRWIAENLSVPIVAAQTVDRFESLLAGKP